MTRKFYKKKMGRPMKIHDQDLKNRIYEYLAFGPNHLACAAAGLSPTIFYEWVNRGEVQFLAEEKEEKEAIYLEFYLNVKKAQALRPLKMVQKITEHADKNWQAAAWICERLNPDEYALKKDELEKKLDDTMNDLKELKDLVERCRPQSIPEYQYQHTITGIKSEKI